MTGKDVTVVLTVDGKAVAMTAIRSHDIQTQAQTIEVASASQGDWREYIAGRKSWSLNVSYLVIDSAKVADLLLVGQNFGVLLKAGSTTVASGSAILTSVRQTATIGNLVQGAFSFIGNGALK